MEDYIIKFASIIKALKRKNRSVISSYKLSPNEIDILVALHMRKYNMAKDIAENFEISKSLVCRSVESLIKKGYIDTKKDEKDKRITHLILKEEAKPIVQALQENREKNNKILLKDIDEKELEIFNNVLDKMKDIGLAVSKDPIDPSTTKNENGFLRRVSDNGSVYPNGDLCDWYGIVMFGMEYGIPSIMVEHAYVDNEQDYYNYLSTDEKLESLAEADAKALIDYYGLI